MGECGNGSDCGCGPRRVAGVLLIWARERGRLEILGNDVGVNGGSSCDMRACRAHTQISRTISRTFAFSPELGAGLEVAAGCLAASADFFSSSESSPVPKSSQVVSTTATSERSTGEMQLLPPVGAVCRVGV